MPAKNYFERATYIAYAQVSGPSGGGPSGENKAMLSLFNPNASGKTIKVWKLRYQALSSSGTNLMVEHDLRRITAHSGGTALTAKKRDSTNDAAVGEALSEPNVTGGAEADRLESFILQSNTVQSPNGHEWRLGDLNEEQPLVLRENEGVVVHQVTSNGGTFAITLVWTEE